MKKLAVFILLFCGFVLQAQIFKPVKWDYQSKKIGDKEYELIFIATLDENWVVYSQFLDEGGPIPTSFAFDENTNIEFLDNVTESEENRVTKKDPLFGNIEVTKFYKRAIFKQKVKLKNNNTTIKGSITYMSCDNERCLPPENEPFEFKFSLEGASASKVNIDEGIEVDEATVNHLLYGIPESRLKKSDIKCDNEVVSNASKARDKSKSLWSVFGLGMLGGLLALLTPCVFPMIPLTVSFFTKKEGQENTGKPGVYKAMLYGFFILMVYLVLSIPFHLLDSINPDILNDISTNVWLNFIFFIIFMFFAFSFFGFYELTLPTSWTNKTTEGENSGGLLGVFFMALTLAIVSFSCTGPILGSLLAGSLTSDGGAWQLTAGMGGFGVALGLPFALFAMFPGWLNSLPKSGGWLNTTKVVLGFLELALAFKFLSVADLVQHWNILKIEPFLIIWIVIFTGLSLYLFGKIKFPHDSPINKLSFSRITFGVLVVAFTIYLASGFRVNKETNTFQSLTLLSGLAPPVGYSFIYPNECPNNLDCYKDLKSGIAQAKKVNKPIMIDFTGYGCVNCRKMEEHVWPLESIDKYLREDYVLISLYVDDKKMLPENEQVYVKRINGGLRKLESYGDKWAHFQTQYFQNNSQPYYVLLSPDGKTILNTPVGYTPNEDEYAQFLQCGLDILE